MADTFPKKTCYHSALRGAGKLVVMFITEVTASQYKGKPPYVVFKVDGDAKEYQYTVENDGIGTLIKGIPRNQWVEIEATGTKEDAGMTVTYLREQPAQPSPPSPALSWPANGVSSSSSSSSAHQAAEHQQAPDQNGDSLARVLWRALGVAHDLEAKYAEKFGAPMTENVRALAVGLTIEVHRGNRLPLSN